MNRLLPLKTSLLLTLLLLVSGSGWAATSVSKSRGGCGLGEKLTCGISGQNLTCDISIASLIGCSWLGPRSATSIAPAVLTNVWFPNAAFVGSPDRVCASGGSTYCWHILWVPNSYITLLDDDSDDDNDGIADVSDNCPLNADGNQLDTDGDAQGNVCDSDDDNDGVTDGSDKFPLNVAASSDTDNDGFPNNWNAACDVTCQANSGLTLDNCPTTSNSTQANFDGDSQGDACDSDDDNDGVPDSTDAFDFDPTESVDTDSDGIGNNTDWDDDNDGAPDTVDAAPLNNADTSEIVLPLDGGYKGTSLQVGKQAQ